MKCPDEVCVWELSTVAAILQVAALLTEGQLQGTLRRPTSHYLVKSHFTEVYHILHIKLFWPVF